ncbi:hypothetical protein AHiyo8_49230 [Arthrobacter sp. Hiyo8]|uniref:hypothetical protein n=1 Tax=Arthrobacter sp. Hiyo1 TaxID=1588020 RepID=UPI000683AC1E|nr:hypothetical protein [Arthrobacter sp. Hiyo1]BAS16620.1 hypothetical protein AHiyo8_49230 [Arthrobacter sp. Hiyo8]GAP57342.1 hypothetical protein AHiyo1_01750 [Arthrobacter sp. Hiyo1]
MASEHRSAATIGIIVAAVALASIPLSFTGPEELRLVVIGPFLLSGPGTALILLLKPARLRKGTGSGVLPLAVAIAVSFSLASAILLSTAMLYAGFWHPSAAVSLLAGLTLGLLAAVDRRSRRKDATQEPN